MSQRLSRSEAASDTQKRQVRVYPSVERRGNPEATVTLNAHVQDEYRVRSTKEEPTGARRGGTLGLCGYTHKWRLIRSPVLQGIYFSVIDGCSLSAPPAWYWDHGSCAKMIWNGGGTDLKAGGGEG
jgi:hypothetical protein